MAKIPTVDELALSIADKSALSAIDGNARWVAPSDHGFTNGEVFWDISDCCEDLAEEILYLEFRELLERHPSHNEWVRLYEFDEEEVADEAVPVQ